MTRDKRIPATGVIVEVLENGCCRAELPNGKIVFAFPGKALPPEADRTFRAGDRLALSLTPYDFSRAEITGLEKF